MRNAKRIEKYFDAIIYIAAFIINNMPEGFFSKEQYVQLAGQPIPASDQRGKVKRADIENRN
jgi:hypothetical protein